MTRLTVCLPAALLAAGLTFAPAAAETKADAAFAEKVRQVLMDDPEMIIDALNEYEEVRRADAEKKRREAVTANLSKVGDLPLVHVAGNPDGKVQMVEFFDYNCGFCKSALPVIMEMIENEPELGVTFVEFPILSAESLTASQAALAAGKQDRYFDMHRALMTATGRVDKARAIQIATDLGLDPKRFAKDMESDEVADAMDQHRALGMAMEVDGTPAFIVGDEPVVGWQKERVAALIRDAVAE